MQKQLDELARDQGRLMTDLAIVNERLKMGDMAMKLAKKRTWVDWILQGVGILGVIALLGWASTKASANDVTVLGDRVRRVEVAQSAQEQLISALRDGQAETRRLLERLDTKVDTVLNTLRSPQQRGKGRP